MEVKILVDNTASSKYLAQSGFSAIIKDEGQKILFDAGQSKYVLKKNLELMNENDKFDSIIFSHGHYDHTDGFNYFIEKYGKNMDIPVYIHKDAFKSPFIDDRYIGIDEKIKEFLRRYENTVYVEKKVKISKNLIISGSVERNFIYEKEKFYTIENGEKTEDVVLDDMFLVANNTIITGCSHSGIINCIENGKSIKDIFGVIGGFHMHSASENYLKKVKEYISKQNFKLISPMHCTGFNTTKELSSLKGFKFGMVGTVFKI
ncbi:conserved hypothetical protein [Methanococcus vannielii SB]|uniref:Metallo-beta-lactamase domain-containing protein n=1 Tax=Methanococcus vannielii (strain ATCC 35089 / DSM 1224 / JCM 13029 / OCM 148 / SB) TaxID=406327 RepID=A6US77_METVS|nr:MBL fold metallo-hydrolase [Methanococcus vannielii]ABR55349.1 conserved hypothetical protein [Methanococcus vannielii SB]